MTVRTRQVHSGPHLLTASLSRRSFRRMPKNPQCSGLSDAARKTTLCQKPSRVERAASAPTWPLTGTAEFIALAECPRDAIDLRPGLLEQAIESAPSKRAARAAALGRKWIRIRSGLEVSALVAAT